MNILINLQKLNMKHKKYHLTSELIPEVGYNHHANQVQSSNFPGKIYLFFLNCQHGERVYFYLVSLNL